VESGETLCHNIFSDRPLTTGSLMANIYCMIHGQRYRRISRSQPRSNIAATVNSLINNWPLYTAGCHLLSLVQATTNAERL